MSTRPRLSSLQAGAFSRVNSSWISRVLQEFQNLEERNLLISSIDELFWTLVEREQRVKGSRNLNRFRAALTGIFPSVDI